MKGTRVRLGNLLTQRNPVSWSNTTQQDGSVLSFTYSDRFLKKLLLCPIFPEKFERTSESTKACYDRSVPPW